MQKTTSKTEDKLGLFGLRSLLLEAGDANHIYSSDLLITLEDKISYTFNERKHLVHALTHSSVLNEFPSLGMESYERSEFLGDAIVDMLITSHLFFHFPNLNEGEMSKFRSALVNESSLKLMAQTLNLSDYILCGRGELQSNTPNSASVQADVFEAIIAAIYIDGGQLAVSKSFEHIISRYEELTNGSFFDQDKLYTFDAKSQLQEKTMALYKSVPEYLAEEFREQQFRIQIKINNKIVAEGEFNSKKKGSMLLAAKVLKDKAYLGL